MRRARSARSACPTSPRRRWRCLTAHLPFPLASTPAGILAAGHRRRMSDGILDQAMALGLWPSWRGRPLGGGRLGSSRRPEARGCSRGGTGRQGQAAESGVSRAAVAYSWIMAHPARPDPHRRHPDPRPHCRNPGRLQAALDPCRLVSTSSTASRGERPCHDPPALRDQLVLRPLRRRLRVPRRARPEARNRAGSIAATSCCKPRAGGLRQHPAAVRLRTRHRYHGLRPLPSGRC